MNRHVLEVQLSRIKPFEDNDYDDHDDENVPEQEAHPLVPLGKVHSGTAASNIVWPVLTKGTSWLLHRKAKTKIYSRVLYPMVGPYVLQQYRGRSLEFECIATKSTVQVSY
jgi:hypothetical protein